MNDGVRRFFERWAEAYKTENAKFDHPIMRRLLWDMPELKVIAIPPEYNVRNLRGIVFRSANESTPHLLHLPWYNSSEPVGWRLWRTIRTFRFDLRNAVLVIRALFM
jgi:hypothetical protein